MFGEFMAFQISESNEKYVSSHKTTTTQENRYLYPNYLSVINFDCKTYPGDRSWPISKDSLEILNNVYGDKHVVLPTHWNNPDLSLTGLPCSGLRFICDDPNLLKLAYICFWIKSHSKANSIWPQREQDINELILSGHPNSEKIKQLVASNYHNWKFLAYRDNILKNGELDLRLYMEHHWSSYVSSNIRRPTSQRLYFDIGKALHGDGSNLPLLENFLGVKFKKMTLKRYRETDLELLKNFLGLSLTDLSKDSWLDILYEWVSEEINRPV